MIGDLFDSPWKILIVAVVLIVLFGSAKLPGAARSLGKSMRILKAEVKDFHEEGTAQVPVAQVPAAQVPVAEVPVAQVPVAQVPVAQAGQPAQQRIDDLERQLAELKEPAAGPAAVQHTGQHG